jgi:cytochrome P450
MPATTNIQNVQQVEQPQRARCPVDHAALSRQKTARRGEHNGPALERDAGGTWHVRGYREARAILRDGNTKQAGFKAELIEQMPRTMNLPVLYQEGQVHHQQRKQTARFFTPKATSTNYRELMERLADDLIARLRQHGRANLSTLSMALAVRVAAKVVGLTNSRLPGMDRRLDAFFAEEIARPGWSLKRLFGMLRNQWCVARFYMLDVRPAIRARRRQPQEDVISHLLAQGYRDSEILTECVTYAAAGMATTREFIGVAAWHFLERPELRVRFLAGDEDERHQLLQEVLRVEPVVGHLYRRAVADVVVETEGSEVTIPAGDLIDVHIYAVNADEQVVGEEPLAICPARELRVEHASPAVMSFGDGHHRCPGAFIAIQETDIFLKRLLAIDKLRIEQGPKLTWSDLTKGYELRDFTVVVG